MTVEAMLEELAAAGWVVTCTGGPLIGFTVRLSGHGEYTYTGTTISGTLARAWAGEPANEEASLLAA